ncbi:MAG: hypothetical protein CUN55_05110, partial [Phototrophicales bacterium]
MNTTIENNTKFYRLQTIHISSVVIYIIASIISWGFFSTPIISFLLLAIVFIQVLNLILPKRFASGFQLEPNGFILRRSPFGMRKIYYNYDGFLRLLVLPNRNRYIFMFDSKKFSCAPKNKISMFFLPHQIDEQHTWLSTPSTVSKQFAAAFIKQAEQITLTSPNTD